MPRSKTKNNFTFRQILLNSISDAVVMTDLNLKIIDWNREAENLYKWEKDQVLGKDFRKVLPLKNRSSNREDIVKEIKNKGQWKGEVHQIAKDGTVVTGYSSVGKMYDENKNHIGYTAVITDISKFKKIQNNFNIRIAQQRAVASLGQYALMSDDPKKVFKKSLEVLNANLDIDFAKILKLNKSKKCLIIVSEIGFGKQVIEGKTKVGIGKDSQAGYTFRHNKPVIVKDLRKDSRFRGMPILRRNNVISGMTVVIANSKNNPFGVLGVHSKRDVKYTKDDINFLVSVSNILAYFIRNTSSQEKLKQFQNRLTSAQQSGGIGLYEWNMTDDKLWLSEEEQKMLGINVESGSSSDWKKVVHQSDIKKIKEEVRYAIRTQQDPKFEFRVRKENGETRWMRGKGKIQKQNGKVIIQGANYDVTEVKKLERNLEFRAQVAKTLGSSLDFKTILRSTARIMVPAIADWCAVDILSDDGQFDQVEVIHPDAKKIEWAKKMRKKHFLNLSRNVGIVKVVNTGEAEFYPEITDNLLKKEAKNKTQYNILKKVGMTSVIIVPIKVLYKTIGTITLISAQSQRKYSEVDLTIAKEIAGSVSLALENSLLYTTVESERERLKTLLSSTPGVFWEAWEKPDESGRKVNYVSENVTDVLGYTADDWLSEKDFWLKCVYKKDREKAEKRAAELYRKGKSGVNRFRWVKKNGEVIWVEARSTIVRDSKGNKLGMRGIDMDVTDRMELEERKDEFISLASHELKTPLTSLRVYAQLLQKKIKTQNHTEYFDSLDKIDKQIMKLASLIDDLLDLSRIQSGKLMYEMEIEGVDKLVDETIESFSHIDSHKIINKGKTKAKTYLDSERISQVITNFITNAIKYSPEKSTITVKKEKNNGEVIISVHNEGKGISKKHQKKIFDRFYQVEKDTERSSSGLGIGLYISSEIIKNHKGKIWLDSKKGEGTTFYFSLPISNIKPTHHTRNER